MDKEYIRRHIKPLIQMVQSCKALGIIAKADELNPNLQSILPQIGEFLNRVHNWFFCIDFLLPDAVGEYVQTQRFGLLPQRLNVLFRSRLSVYLSSISVNRILISVFASALFFFLSFHDVCKLRSFFNAFVGVLGNRELE